MVTALKQFISIAGRGSNRNLDIARDQIAALEWSGAGDTPRVYVVIMLKTGHQFRLSNLETEQFRDQWGEQ